MKQSIKKLGVIIVGLLFATNVLAQMPQLPELTDSAVRIGKLPNGLTYYIRHNEYPKGQVDFHIAQKVGAVQENENQNGLAHFLEHMCFNGTKNFPDKQILTWLESKGVKFGANLNAHTGTDETVYDIVNVPSANKEVVDSCLLILHDWADALTLADEEIEKERGVIHEEWRIGNGAIQRVLNKYAPMLYPNTKYATHNVIGSMNVIDNFKPQVLRDYYEKWYRPDLQGIIVVGDVDVDRVETKIKEIFSPIKMPINAAAFAYETVADNDAPIVISEKDKEMPVNLILVAQKYDFLPREYRNTFAGLQIGYLNYVLDVMLGNRLTEITLSKDAPFANCNANMGSFLYANTKGALVCEAIVNDKGSEAALRAVITELKRVKEHGFTAAEYDRARTEYLSALEKQYHNFGTAKNDYFAEIYIRNFLESQPVTAVDYEYLTMKDIVSMLPVEVVNQYVKEIFTGKNQAVISFCPENENVAMPTVEALTQVVNEVNASEVEAYVDTAINEPLLPEMPAAGKIKKQTENTVLGYTELELSNGAKVILKKTDFKDNEILMRAVSKGGASLYDAADYPSAVLATDVLGVIGLGKFSYTDLQKMLSGKQVSVSPSIGKYSEEMEGSSSVKDLETMMQLVYLNFTQPREDKESFENVKKLMLSQIENVERNPQYVFQDSLVRNIVGHHPKAMIQSKNMFERMDYGRMMQIYKERFANAADFTFVFSGNFDMDMMKKFVEIYIASLPSSKNKEVAENDGLEMVKGHVRKQFVLNNENKLAMLAMVWNMAMPYTLENKIKISIAGQLMANELLNSVREDDGAAYSPYSVGSFERSYDDNVIIQTAFGLNPDKSAKSEQTTINCLEKLASNVPEAELAKMKEYMLKKHGENAVENSYWLNVLTDSAVDGLDMYSNYNDIVNALTVKDMQDFIAKIINSGNRFELLMLPE